MHRTIRIELNIDRDNNDTALLGISISFNRLLTPLQPESGKNKAHSAPKNGLLDIDFGFDLGDEQFNSPSLPESHLPVSTDDIDISDMPKRVRWNKDENRFQF